MARNGEDITIFTNPNHLSEARVTLRQELAQLALESPHDEAERLIVTCDMRPSPIARLFKGDWDVTTTDVSDHPVWNRGEDIVPMDISLDALGLRSRFPTQFPEGLPKDNLHALYVAEGNNAEEIPYDLAMRVLCMRRKDAQTLVHSTKFMEMIQSSRTDAA